MSTVQPIWITPPGSLGTVPEGAFYQVPLQVDQPGGDPVYFEAIAGDLPSGIQCTANGVIQGVPTNVITVANEAVVAGVNVTSKFAIRAYTTSTVGNITVINKLADRTFTLTVAGQNNPTWITPGATTLSNVTITNNTGGFTSSSINLTPGQVVSVSGSFSNASGNILVPTYTGSANYYVLSTSVPDAFVLIDDLENPVVLSNVTIANIAGGFVFDAANSVVARPLVLTVDQPVLITGNFSGSGSINGYSSNTTYYIKTTNSVDAFVLSTSPGGANVTTTVGNTTGTNFSLTNNIVTVPGNTTGVTFNISGSLGNYFYTGQQLEPGIQLEYTNDNTTGIPPAITLFSGALPPGLELSPTGLISGVIGLNPAISLEPGFDNSPFDAKTLDSNGYLIIAPFDFDVASENANYEFTLRLTDGRVSVFRTFSMFVWSTSTFNASTTEITADNTNLTVDISNSNIPVILNEEGSIGTAPNSTFFAYQFLGEDISGDNVGFIGYFIPPGLTLDTESGWLYGYLPNLGLTEQTYNFQVAAYSIPEPTLISLTYQYSLTVTGPISTNVTWLTPSDLGTIDNGATSILYIEAKTTANLPLQYRIASGSDSRLPQGLTLLPSGHIVGRVSFNTFAVDDGNTTFDSDTTTFDLTCTFTVNAYSINGFVSVNKTFTIRVLRTYDKPYENLYIQCMPPVSDRSLIQNLVQNSIIFPPSLIYRNDDTNFGVANQVVYYHAYGLAADTVDTYVSALQLNHYWKNLILGEIKTAQAVDPVTGNIIYEVVYSEIIDTLVNNEGVSVGKEVVLPYLIENQTVDVVYPNSLENMRDQVIDVVGQESDILPLWMQSVQTDGNVLGFTPAWVIAYTLPGKSGQIQYNIQSQFGIQLNQVDFQADRYELDRALTVNWSAYSQQWIPTPPIYTTFDIDYHYNLILTNSGNGYATGNQLRIIGADAGATIIPAGSLFATTEYTIATVGTTNWVAIGANSTAVVTGAIADGISHIDTGIISGVAIDIVLGTFTYTSVTGNIVIGQCVTISGTNTGTGYIIDPPYTNPSTYYVIDTGIANSIPYFTLSTTLGGNAITTYAGSTSGWNFNLYGGNVLNVTGVTSGTLSIGTYITGTGITPGTYITEQLTATNTATVLATFTQAVTGANTITLSSFTTGTISNVSIGQFVEPISGILPNTYVTAIDTNANVITISNNTISSVSGVGNLYVAGNIGTYQVNLAQLAPDAITITGQPKIGATFVNTGIGSGTGIANYSFNDIIIDINTVGNTGNIVNVFYSGTADMFAYGNSYSSVSSVDITGSGIGAIWTVIPVPGNGATVPAATQWLNNNNTSVGWINNSNLPVVFTPGGTIIFDTTFDGGSLTFSSPADVYTNTDAYNKYLLFPKYDILNPLPEFGGTEVYWINNYDEFIQWTNNSSDPVAWVSTL